MKYLKLYNTKTEAINQIIDTPNIVALNGVKKALYVPVMGGKSATINDASDFINYETIQTIPPADEVWVWGKTDTTPITLGWGAAVTYISSTYDGEKLIYKFSGTGSLGEGFTRSRLTGYIAAIGENFTLKNAFNFTVTQPLLICNESFAVYSSNFPFSSSSSVYVPDDFVDTYIESKGEATWASIKPMSSWDDVIIEYKKSLINA